MKHGVMVILLAIVLAACNTGGSVHGKYNCANGKEGRSMRRAAGARADSLRRAGGFDDHGEFR